jgi:preprotein translocase subunit SecB
MAEQGNGNTATDAVKSLSVLAQYVKDLSFENPNAPRSLGPQQGGPQLNLTVNVNGRPLSANDFEVELHIEGGAGEGAGTLFKFEIIYGAILRVNGFPPTEVHPVVMIEGPRLMFPFARQIVADAVRNGGFPPLMIDPIDFVALYQRRAADMAAAEAAKTAN